MKNRTTLIFIFIGLLYAEVNSQGKDAIKPVNLHRVEAGESLNDVAERFMSGSEFASELLELNNIRNPMQVQEGTWIALPGPIRDEASQSLVQAEAALKIARDAQADVYAKHTFSLASEKVDQAKSSRFHANYWKSLAQSGLGEVLAKQAKEEADANALISKDGRISIVHGQVEVSENNGATWQIVPAGTPLSVRAFIRTDPTSRAEVVLDDGSVLQVMESSEFSIEQFIKDRRDGKVDVLLDVRVGSILGKIKPKTGGSKLNINSGKSVIAVRGTVLRVSRDMEHTIYSEVHDGNVEVASGGGSASVDTGFGVKAKVDQPPSKPKLLLPAPEVNSAWFEKTTAVQRVALNWDPIKKKRRVGTYRVEIATDFDFYRYEQSLDTKDSEIQTEILREGDYYWRVSTIDRQGLAGVPSAPQQLFIRKDLGAELWYRGKLVERQGGYVAGPQNEYHMRPLRLDTSIVGYEFRINEDEYSTLTEPVVIEQDGDYVLRMRSLGIEGDLGSVQSLSFQVDATPPEVSLHVGSPFVAPDGTTAVEATLAATDDTGVERIEISVDKSQFSQYEGPFTLSAYKDYAVRFRAVDVLGNSSPEFAVRLSGQRARRGDFRKKKGSPALISSLSK